MHSFSRPEKRKSAQDVWQNYQQDSQPHIGDAWEEYATGTTHIPLWN